MQVQCNKNKINNNVLSNRLIKLPYNVLKSIPVEIKI